MKCRQCGYRLWNLVSRECPECGESFSPAEFQFTPNTVQFCCPHCSQPYYGTDENGLPTPRSFNCIGCHRDISLDQMVLFPVDADEEATISETHPWLDRENRGFFRRFWSGVYVAMFQPGRMIRIVPPDSSLGSAWSFGMLANLCFVLVASSFSVLFVALFLAGTRGAFPGGGAGGVAPSLGMFGIGMFAGVGCAGVGALLVIALGVLVWGAVTQLLLKLTGSTGHTIGRTYQCLLYSGGANALTMVPFCGGYVGWIWWLVSAVVAVREGQKVSGVRAGFAVLTPPLVMAGMSVVLYAIWIVSILNANPAFQNVGNQPFSFMTDSQKVGNIAGAQELYANLYPEATGQQHPVVLVQQELLVADDFIATGSKTSLDDIPIGSVTLREFLKLDENRQTRAAKEATKLLPAAGESYRVGDAVFVGLGDKTEWVTPGTWELFIYPDMSFNTTKPLVYWVMFSDGHLESLPLHTFMQRLEAQNKFRAEQGQPPIPAPSMLRQLPSGPGVEEPSDEE